MTAGVPQYPSLSKLGFDFQGDEPKVAPKKRLYYDGAGGGRRSTGWRPANVGPQSVVAKDLPTLRARSRELTRNNPYGAGGVEKLVTNIIGTGIKPLSQTTNETRRNLIKELWPEWVGNASLDGSLDFYGLQTQVTRSWIESGECFVRFVIDTQSTGEVPLKIQVIESDHVPSDLNESKQGANPIRAGIELDNQGRRVAYRVYPLHPSEEISKTVPIPASEMLHIHEPLRPGQLRGAPKTAPILLRMRDLLEFDDATLFRQKIANLFTGFIRRDEHSNLDPLNEETAASDLSIGLEPGTLQELPDGTTIDWSKPPSAGSDYPDYMRQQLMAAAAGLGLPYELFTGDMRDLNDRVVRAILNEFRRRVKQIQNNIIIHQFCRAVWLKWLDVAVLSGMLPSDGYSDPLQRIDFRKVRWIPQGWPYLHPVQDVEAHKMSVRSGFNSRQGVISELGRDAETIDDEISTDNLRSDDLGLIFDSDGRVNTEPSFLDLVDE